MNAAEATREVYWKAAGDDCNERSDDDNEIKTLKDEYERACEDYNDAVQMRRELDEHIEALHGYNEVKDAARHG